jgi:hypothetical protein
MNLITITEHLPIKHVGMLAEISVDLPMIEKATKNFNKQQSQFMDTMLTVNKLTDLRSARQILAEVTKSKQALDEAYFKLRKKDVQVRQFKAKLLLTVDNFEKELLTIKIQEIESQINTTMNYVDGAVRKIHAYLAQYKNILKRIGKDELTEEDFEKDEERYHIITVFNQALCAARSRGGIIDEGNHIYFNQIGINGTAAQIEVSAYLQLEQDMLTNNQISTHKNTITWLEKMASKYVGCSVDYAKRQGLSLLNKDSLNR